jgi:CrcB protein
MLKIFLIGCGGGIGSVLRYLMQHSVQSLVGATFPLGTLLVNVLGCLVLGTLAALFAGPIVVREEVRLGLTVGVLGGFTTFSTFGLETFDIAGRGDPWSWTLAAANIVLSCGLGLLAIWVGTRIGHAWLGA